MTDEMTEVSLDGLLRLRSAASDFARPEITRIAQAVVGDLQSRPAVGTFGDVAARHMWDEYCWSLQEGPFDDDEYVGGLSLGSVSGNWDDTVRAFVGGEVEKLPRYAEIFLSAHAFEEDADSDEDESVGNIWVDGIVDSVMEDINKRASRRNLDLIGPERGDVIGYEIEGSGTVWSALSERGEAMDLVASHVDAMVDPDGDLSDLASEMVEAFMVAAKEGAAETMFSEFFDNFEDQVRGLLTVDDVLPTLEDIRSDLLYRLDR